MARTRLTDRAIKALKAAPAGSRYDLMDTDVPGLGVRVTDSGHRSFVLFTRYPGSANPTRRALGEYGPLTLEEARRKARHWHNLIRQGVDPKVEEEERRRAEAQRRENTFGAVAEDFTRLFLVGPDSANPRQRTGIATARELRTEFAELWARPIDSITPRDIVKVLDAAIERGAAYHAHHLLAHVRRMYNWAIARGVYGIEGSPCDRMKPSQVIGPKALRTRVLTDDEIRRYWRAAEAMNYPFGPMMKLLLLTGQRRSEVAEMTWSELDLRKRVWVIPETRMKAKAAHVVPLTGQVLGILNDIPQFARQAEAGDFIFSTTFGRAPVSVFSKAKVRLDRMMRELAPAGVAIPPWVLHDVRRTVRTKFSALPISDLVRELVIAHSKPTLHKVYDQHAYLDEKRQALELWETALAGVLSQRGEPP